MKNFALVVLCLVLIAPQSWAKKNDEFTLAEKKYKPKNEKILKRLWSKGLKSGGPKKRYYPETSNVTLHGGMIYVGTHGGVFYAVNQADGKVAWEYKNEEPISSTASVSGGRVFFTDLGGRVICLDQNNGTLMWSQQMNQEMLGRPLVTQGKVFLLKGEQELVALSETDGHVIWNRFIRTYIKKITMRGHSSMVADGGSVYVGLADGHLYKVAMKDGRIQWDKNLNIPLRTFKDIDAQVVIDGDSLFVGGYFGMVYRLKKSNGAIVWASEVPTGLPVLVTANTVVVSDTDGSVVGIDKDSGRQQWTFQTERNILSAPVAYGDRVFVTSFRSEAYLLDLQTGRQIQKMSIGEGAISQPLVDQSQIYTLTNGAKVLALGQR